MDKLLFVREDVVEAAWSIVDPILNNNVPLQIYNPGTWGPEEAARLAADVNGWCISQPKLTCVCALIRFIQLWEAVAIMKCDRTPVARCERTSLSDSKMQSI